VPGGRRSVRRERQEVLLIQRRAASQRSYEPARPQDLDDWRDLALRARRNHAQDLYWISMIVLGWAGLSAWFIFVNLMSPDFVGHHLSQAFFWFCSVVASLAVCLLRGLQQNELVQYPL
jgi:hypothetical protein